MGGTFDLESRWRYLTSHGWNRVDSRFGTFDGWGGRVPSTVVMHLHEICLSVVHDKLIRVLTRRKMVAFELWMYFSSHSLSIHERRMVGLRTVGLS